MCLLTAYVTGKASLEQEVSFLAPVSKGTHGGAVDMINAMLGKGLCNRPTALELLGFCFLDCRKLLSGAPVEGLPARQQLVSLRALLCCTWSSLCNCSLRSAIAVHSIADD